jgi:hypothetical protein
LRERKPGLRCAMVDAGRHLAAGCAQPFSLKADMRASPTHRARQAFSRVQLACAMLVGSLGLLIFGLQPVLLGELVNAHRVSLEGVGVIAMVEIIAVAAGVTMGDVWLPAAHVRRIALLAAVVASGLDLATLYVGGDASLAAVRGVEGLAEGLLAWVAISALIRADHPEQLGAHFVAMQTALQAAMAC